MTGGTARGVAGLPLPFPKSVSFSVSLRPVSVCSVVSLRGVKALPRKRPDKRPAVSVVPLLGLQRFLDRRRDILDARGIQRRIHPHPERSSHDPVRLLQ
jgi:hypothetical protein